MKQHIVGKRAQKYNTVNWKDWVEVTVLNAHTVFQLRPCPSPKSPTVFLVLCPSSFLLCMHSVHILFGLRFCLLCSHWVYLTSCFKSGEKSGCLWNILLSKSKEFKDVKGSKRMNRDALRGLPTTQEFALVESHEFITPQVKEVNVEYAKSSYYIKGTYMHLDLLKDFCSREYCFVWYFVYLHTYTYT